MPPEKPKSYLGDEIHSSQRTTLILVHHSFFLTVNESLKERKKKKNKLPQQNPTQYLRKRNLLYTQVLFYTQNTEHFLSSPFMLCVNNPTNILPFIFIMLHLDTL